MVLETVLIEFLTWAVVTIGSAFIITLLWIGRKLGERLGAIEAQLATANASIATTNTAIATTNKLISEIEVDLRKDINEHETKIAILYSRCGLNHGTIRRTGDYPCS